MKILILIILGLSNLIQVQANKNETLPQNCTDPKEANLKQLLMEAYRNNLKPLIEGIDENK